MTEADHVDTPATIRRLVGVYNADGTVRGELAYFARARFGRAHCALCDITHGLVRERSDWKECRARLPVAFDTYHRNDQPREIRDATGNLVPVVVAETERGVITLLGPAELDACGGSVDQLEVALETAMDRLALRWD